MKREKMLLCIGAIILSSLMLCTFWMIPWILMAGSAYLSTPNQPEPVIHYGEFPFRLVYELEGKVYEIEDSVVCEYEGQDFSVGTGEKYRKWKSSLKSGNTRITLLHTEDGIEIFFLNLSWFPASLYMGDPESKSNTVGTFPNALYTSDFENKTVGKYIIKAEEMWEKYRLKLISWEISPPIENSFGDNNDI